MIKFLDCTLRDGGYYNAWDFQPELINSYLTAMQAAKVDVVELGLRSLKNQGFKGACAYTTDDFLDSLKIPEGIQVGVMINAVELVGDIPLEEALEALFPVSADNLPGDLVRIACHVHEFTKALPASRWLKACGYRVGFNLMQVAECNQREIEILSQEAAQYPIDAFYFVTMVA